jgi:hypothetical protein
MVAAFREPEVRPKRVRHDGETYRRRMQAPKKFGTLFGKIQIRRTIYECLEPGEPCIIPFELERGVVAGLATPALAERVGRWSANHSQKSVLSLLKAEHNVPLSVGSLRKIVAAVEAGVEKPGLDARQDKMLDSMKSADASKGRHRPVVSVGRDGVMVPVRETRKQKKAHASGKSEAKAKSKENADAGVKAKAKPKIESKKLQKKGQSAERAKGYREASVGTVSFQDRSGKRIGTVYFARMPESGQGTLTKQLLGVVTSLLLSIHTLGMPCPRLTYVTDAGPTQRRFYKEKLRKMDDPWHPGVELAWDWTVDFYHACTYLWKMAEALHGDTPVAWNWFRKMRHWLRREKGGASNVLRSASQLSKTARITGERKKAFDKAYRYLRKYAPYMDYAGRSKKKLPIGSGVTEAACKTVFGERLKRSGMAWGIDGGQRIVNLRVLVLSDVWEASYLGYLRLQKLPEVVSVGPNKRKTPRKPA